MPGDERECRLRQQGGQIDARNQHVGGGAPTAEAVPQHRQENLGRGRFDRRVQCGHAQRSPHQPNQALGLIEALQQFGHAAVVVQAPVHPARAGGKARQRQLVRARQAAAAPQRRQQMQGRRQAGGDEFHAVAAGRIAHLQRQPQQALARIDADGAHQAQGFAIGAEQDVLAVVQRDAVALDRARASARDARGFEYRDVETALAPAPPPPRNRPSRRRSPRPAAHRSCGLPAASRAHRSSTPARTCGSASARCVASARGNRRARFP